VEVRASAYVGDNFARTREIIWEQALAGLDQGDAVVVWKSLTDQGYGFLTTGKKPLAPDGLKLVIFFGDKRPQRLLRFQTH
jgi:CRISPR-associated protein Cas2